MGRRATHGHYKDGVNSKTVNSWTSMLARCTDPSHDSYKRYGGKGIAFDPYWLDFKNFLADMGERPEGYTLDRINPDKGYCKANCRWVCPARQQHTRRDAKLTWEKIKEIKHRHAEGFPQSVLAGQFDVDQSTISRVVNGKRWKAELPVLEPETST